MTPASKVIRDARKGKGLTVSDLAERTGIHRITLTRYESGETRVGGKNAPALSRALDVPIEKLLTV